MQPKPGWKFGLVGQFPVSALIRSYNAPTGRLKNHLLVIAIEPRSTIFVCTFGRF
jgi:hypothetical protein